MKYLFSVVFIFLFCAITHGQSFKYKYEKECGSPFSSSHAYYGAREGKVISVINGNTVTFKQNERGGKKEKRTLTLHLAGIDSTVNEDNLVKFLTENVMNKKITVYGNAENDSDEHIFGILWGAGFADVNQHLLENGMADYSRPAYFYSVSDHRLCVYQVLVKEAKVAKLGIWAK